MNGIRNTWIDHEEPRFGAALRALRRRQGLTLAELAERTHYSRGHLANVERGVKAATPDLAHVCDTVLSSGQALQALLPTGHPAAPHSVTRSAHLPPASPRSLRSGQDGNELVELGRRYLSEGLDLIERALCQREDADDQSGQVPSRSDRGQALTELGLVDEYAAALEDAAEGRHGEADTLHLLAVALVLILTTGWTGAGPAASGP